MGFPSTSDSFLLASPNASSTTQIPSDSWQPFKTVGSSGGLGTSTNNVRTLPSILGIRDCFVESAEPPICQTLSRTQDKDNLKETGHEPSKDAIDGKKWGRFSPDKKQKDKTVRRLEACLHCRIYKEPVRLLLSSTNAQADLSVWRKYTMRKLREEALSGQDFPATLLSRVYW